MLEGCLILGIDLLLSKDPIIPASSGNDSNLITSLMITAEKTSVLDDIDFELELIHRDEINVTYILKLLAKLSNSSNEEIEKQKKNIYDLLSGDVELRSKKELIEKFIEQNLPIIKDNDDIPDEFNKFWEKEKKPLFKN